MWNVANTLFEKKIVEEHVYTRKEQKFQIRISILRN